MGIVPIWGFQLAIAIALAFAFRLNKALVMLAANISIPPMLPLILFLSHLTGRIWMGNKAQHISFRHDITLDTLGQNLLQYMLGATTLAVIAGVVVGTISYLILKLSKR